MALREAKGTIHAAIAESLLKHVPDTVAKEIVRSMVRGEIPHIAIQYRLQ